MNLFLTDAANVLSVTVTAGEVSDIVMGGTGVFYEIQADQNSVKRLCNGSRANKSFTLYNHTIDFKVSKASLEVNTLTENLDDGQPCGFIAIIMDSNGIAWLVGWSVEEERDRPLYLEANDFDSGEAPTGGGNNNLFKLFGINSQKDLPCDDTINQYISDSIAAGTDLGFTP
jgi:hypothetical protein